MFEVVQEMYDMLNDPAYMGPLFREEYISECVQDAVREHKKLCPNDIVIMASAWAENNRVFVQSVWLWGTK